MITLTQAVTAVDNAQAEYAKQKATGAYLAAVDITKRDRQAVIEMKARLHEAQERVQRDLEAEDLLAANLNKALDQTIAIAQAAKVPVQAGKEEPPPAV